MIRSTSGWSSDSSRRQYPESLNWFDNNAQFEEGIFAIEIRGNSDGIARASVV
jgi:hypothetical protein